MIDQWLLGVQELAVRTPGGLARWNEPNYDQAKVNRVFLEVFSDEDDTAKRRPYFLITERELVYKRDGEHTFHLLGSVDVFYTEMLTNPNDYKASHLSFSKFVGDMVESFAVRQGEPIAEDPQTSYLPLARIQFEQMPTRGDLQHEDPDVPGTAFMWCLINVELG